MGAVAAQQTEVATLDPADPTPTRWCRRRHLAWHR